MSPWSWSIAKLDTKTGDDLDAWPFDSEDEAREEFLRLCELANKDGGYYELRRGATWVCRHSVQKGTK